MNGQLKTEKCIHPLVLVMLGMLLASAGAFAQVPVDEDGKPIGTYSQEAFDDDGAQTDSGEMLSPAELEDLVGPVALYPDDLLAIVLPASTYPLEIVQAARFLEQLETDSSLKPDEEWDESVVALLNYPEVVRMMDEDIDWTWRLGEAVLNQQNDVVAAVESFRDRAYAAGNLKSDERQEIKHDEDGIIEIVPVDEEIIYVPYYEPAEVVVYQPRRVYYYYPDPYPLYYYPYPAGYDFHSGFFWGVTTAFTIGWSNHYLHVYHPSYWGHPYYGHYYYGSYYRRPSITVYNNYYVNNNYHTSRYRYRDGDYWRPRTRAGSRPDLPQVTNYHFSPNGSSNNSRNFTVSREQRLRVSEDGRMDLRLRDRDRSNTSAIVNRTSTAAIRHGTGAENRGTAAGRVTNNRTVTPSLRSDAGRRAAGTASTPARPALQVRPDRERNQSATPGNRVTLADRRVSANRQATADAGELRATQPGNYRAAAAATIRPRSNAPATGLRRETQPSVTRATQAARAAAPATTRNVPTARRAAPPAVRAPAPTVQQRAPATPRQETRSSGRSGSGGASRNRGQANGARVRDNH